MKKNFLAICVSILAGLSTIAQNTIFNNPDNKAYFGVRLAADVTCPGNLTTQFLSMDMFKNGAGIEFGGIYNHPLVANLYIEPGLKFFYDTYSIKKDILNDIDGGTRPDKVSYKFFGMRIPVMVGYHFDFTQDIKVSLFTGPEFEIGFSGKEKTKLANVTVSENVYGDDGGMNRFNFLWGVGVGLSYQRYYFGVNGGIGLTNMLDDSDTKFHESRVTFSLGYNF